ncbi:MAG TPA: hypothetical protein PKM65_05840 [Spirochaetota bacterium]|nr:hypothetical protein [Spirochaetota bacterium]HNT10123.1 hypothetical protein [Spirochaetota bacterium]HNV48173.1 hypothetical protein [Spirochaetota bacterium]HOS39668.1 hypothetical protein [Spirochaetota bacterium]HPI22967.1 hypothetical protein [Spirochaetota bacterium]
MKNEYAPENNLVILFLLLVFTAGLYYFWWLARTSRMFNDNPVSNVLLVVLTFGVWSLYINLKYMQKAEELNGRGFGWYMVFFLVISPLVIQHNINERFFPGR